MQKGIGLAAFGSLAAFLAADFAVGAVCRSGVNPLIDSNGAAGAILQLLEADKSSPLNPWH